MKRYWTVRRWVIGLATLAASFSVSLTGGAEVARAAEPPVKTPSPADVANWIAQGDRFADQADFEKAVEQYNNAYQAVVSKVRGQRFLIDVVATLKTRSQLGEDMKRMMKEEYTEDELALMEGSYKAFSLIPADMDVTKLMTDLLTEQVGGFYDPKTREMVLVREDDGAKNPGTFARLFGARPLFDKDEQKTTLAHELTHALQDQLYGLRRMQESIEKDDDMLLAFSALVEGDATLLMFTQQNGTDGGDEALQMMDPEQAKTMFSIMNFMLPVAGGKTYRNAPPIFRDSLTFPYFQGMIFNLAVARDQGWDSIHQAYQAPPLSTEQIMHPEKYASGSEPDAPVAIDLATLPSVVGENYKHLGGNCLGEFQLAILFKTVRGGATASAGWDGDRYEIFKRNDGKLALAWYTTWDSEKDAEQFTKAVERLWKAEDAPAATDEGEVIVKRSADKEAIADGFALKQQSMDVLVTRGFDDEASQSIFAHMLEQGKKSEKKFPVKPESVKPAG